MKLTKEKIDLLLNGSREERAYATAKSFKLFCIFYFRIGSQAGAVGPKGVMHELACDIDTVLVDSLKALDPKRPIREADIDRTQRAGG